MKCFHCGAECVTHVGQRVALDVELSNVLAQGVTVHRCSDEGCGEELVELPNVSGLLAEPARVAPVGLPPKEVRFLRKHLGWSGQAWSPHRDGVENRSASRRRCTFCVDVSGSSDASTRKRARGRL